MTQDDTRTIREMSDSFGVTARALRFYEAKELLNPIRAGQKRLYTRRDRARLTLILKGKRFGFSLEEIRQVLDLYDPQDRAQAQLVEALRLARQHLDRMIDERATLEKSIAELRAEVDRGERSLAEMGATEAA